MIARLAGELLRGDPGAWGQVTTVVAIVIAIAILYFIDTHREDSR